MDIPAIILTALTVIGGARLIFKGLSKIAKLTKTKKDDRFIAKILNVLKDLSEILSLPESESDIKVKVSR